MTGGGFDFKDILRLDAGWLAGRILDVRSRADFLAGRLKGAVSHPLDLSCPADQVPSILLPPRHEPLLVIGGPGQACRELARDLASRGRIGVTALVLGPEELAVLPQEMVATGPDNGHLWAPPAWLARHLDLLPPPAKGPVLDLGCGSGRAAVHLAELGYRVTGLDRQPEALALGRRLAATRGVACRFEAMDLRDPGAVPAGRWAVVLAFRFLQRNLLDRCRVLLEPGGVALVRTFRDVPGYTGPPQRRHRLARGELLRIFPRGRFKILAHEEGFDPDGRPAAGIVARRV